MDVTKPHNAASARSKVGPIVLLLALAAFVAGIVVLLRGPTPVSSETHDAWIVPAPLNNDRAMKTIVAICDFGPRVSGTPGMEKQQQWLQEQFNALGGQVEFQEWSERHPLTGETITLRNMLIKFGPETKERLLISAHYDTRPRPDADLRDPNGQFLGANDGASGPALMIEMGHALQKSPPKIGVTFVLFDAEELVYRPQDKYFIGSEHFSYDYRGSREKRDFNYRYAVNVDMIADKNLELYMEQNSYHYARGLVEQIWGIAAKEKIGNFAPKIVHEVRDDHLPLNEIAEIPAIDIIDFDYPVRGKRGVNYWHTREDLPNKCSGVSVCKVATVLLKWIEEEGDK